MNGVLHVVLGSRKRPDRAIRARRIDCAISRWMVVGDTWVNAERVDPFPPSTEDER